MEGHLVREKLDEGRTKMEKIKDEKLKELGSIGIPNKYKAELTRKKIT